MPQFHNWDQQDEWVKPQYQTPTAAPAPAAPAAPAPDQQYDYGTFELPSYSGPASPTYNFQSAPTFNAPKFNAPTYAQAQNEPGYQFRLDSGRKALENSAAARGILRTGGSLKDFLEYGQNFGAQEYSNVFNRAMQGYQANYQAAKDQFAPQFAQYNNEFNAEQQRALAEFNRSYEVYNTNAQLQMALEQLRTQQMQLPAPTFPTGAY